MFKRLLKDTAIIGFGNLFSKGIIFFLIPLQTSVMTKSEYGIAEMLFNLVNILIPIFTLGIAEAGMRFTLDESKNKEIIFAIITSIPFIGGVILLLLGLIICNVFTYNTDYFYYLFFLYIFFSYKEIYLQFCKGLNLLKLFSLGSILFSFLLFILSYYFLKIKTSGVEGYMYSYIAANLLTVLFLIYKGKFYSYFSFKLINFDFKLLYLMLGYSFPLICNVLAWWITSLSNRYIMAYFCTLEEVGIYSALAKFSLILVTIFTVLFQSWQISAAENIKLENRTIFFSKVYNFFTISIVFCSFIFMLLSENIASIFIRGDFTESYKYIPGMVLTGTACCLPMYWGAIYGALKNTKGAFYSTLCGSIGSVLFNILLIPKFSINGAIISTIISYIIVTIYRTIELNKYIKIDLSLKKHFCGFAIIILQSLIITHYYTISSKIIIELFLMMFLYVLYKNDLNKIHDLIILKLNSKRRKKL